MTRAANAGELTKLRSNGQWARWKVIIDRPDVIYTARSTGTLTLTNYSIPFDTGSGTLTNVKKDMTILIGSTSGGSEHGIGRIRKDSGGGDTSFYVGGDPSLLVADNDYLTILNDFAPMSKHPLDTSIDVDVAYSDQFSAFIPVPHFGNRVQVISAGGTAVFDASTSWVPSSTISAYAWTFTGATSYTDEDTATPTATYNTSGRYKVALTVTAANAKTATGYGWVYVLGENLTAETGCIVSDMEGEFEIGWACRVKAYDRPTIKDLARVVIYAEDYYANALGSIGPVSGSENLVMTGWIIGETIIREPGQDYVEFTVGGTGLICDSIAMLPSGLTDTALPTDAGTTLPAWSKMANLLHRKGLHYLINYRSTLATVVDVTVENWAWPAHKLTADDESLWGQLQTFAKHGLMTCTSDRYGHLWIQRDAAYYPLADRTAYIPVIMTFGDSDWADELSINRRHTGEAAMVEAEGTVFNASTGTVTPAGGRAPGEQPGSHGTVHNVSEINFDSRAQSIEIAGLIMGQLCTEYESIGVVHPSNNRFIDIAPRQYVNVVVDGATLRCIPRRMSQERDDEGQITTELELEPEGGQFPAVNINYPNEGNPPIQPPVTPPVIPPPPPEEPPEEPPETSAADAVVVTSADVKVTANLNEASPAWTSIISGGPTTPIDSDLTEGNNTLFVIEAASIWKCTDIAGTPAWTEVWTGDDLGTGGGGVAISFGSLNRIRVAPGSDLIVYALGYGEVDGTNMPFVLKSSNAGDTWVESWIDDTLPEGTEYTLTTDVDILTRVFPEHASDSFTANHPRTGDAINTKKPWGVAYSVSIVSAPLGWGVGILNGDDCITTEFTMVNNTTPSAWVNDALTSPERDIVEGWLDDTFGIGNYNGGGGLTGLVTPLEANRDELIITSNYGHDFTVEVTTYVFWNIPDVSEPIALDVARTNSNYVYVGTSEKVWKSTDGASTWTESLDATGSNDIHVDPQLAGVYYHWSDTGNLDLVVADTVNATLDTETPTAVPLRLARDLNSGRLWALDSGTKLEMRNLGSWTDQDTGLSGARGLHAYLGGKLIYLEAATILYSDDYGATQADKTGDWSGFGSPINAHLLKQVEA